MGSQPPPPINAFGNQEFDVAIIGAGPVGLALAIETARSGLTTLVVDRRPPLTEDTRGLIDRRALGLMKPSAVVVNVGRGAVIDQAALVQALRDGIIAGAGLDVFEREPLPSDSPLYDMDNVVITPHVSGASAGYMDSVIPLFCENLRRYLDGAPLRNVVDPARGY